jgi:hypothetical protein
MIERINAYKSSDGTVVGSLEQVQRHELALLVSNAGTVTEAIDSIITNRDKVVDILTTGPRSRPSARQINGGTKKRKPPVTADELEQRRRIPAVKPVDSPGGM